MQLSEAELADIMLEHFVGTFPPISPELFWTRERIAQNAAHTIAEAEAKKAREGVVFMGEGHLFQHERDTKDASWTNVLVNNDGFRIPYCENGTDGQLVEVTVRAKEE